MDLSARWSARAVLCGVALFTLLFTPVAARAQHSFRLGGYVQAEASYDTRQVEQIREGELSLFPRPDDATTRTDNLFMGAFRSRLNLTASGAKAFGADATGFVEADFFGAYNPNVNSFRLRHGYVKLDWKRHEVLFGQSFLPMFVAPVIPQLNGSAVAAPFSPLGFATQLSYTWKPGVFRLIGMASQQRDGFSDIGGNKQQQQAGVPAVAGHVQVVEGKYLVGAGAWHKTLRPKLDGPTFGAVSGTVYGKVSLGRLDVRARAVYGEILTEGLMTGGYVTTTSGAYEPLHGLSGWVDVSTTTKPMMIGLFAGYLENRGAAHAVEVASEATRASNMAWGWRVTPYVAYQSGPVRLSFDLETTTVLYASAYDARYRPDPTGTDRPITNVRGMLMARYLF